MKKCSTHTNRVFTALSLAIVGLMLAGCGSGGETPTQTTTATTTAATTTATTATTTSTPVSRQLTLDWNPAAGATSYNLYWSTVPGVTTTNGTKISNVSMPYVHTGLAADTTYYYIVTAVDSSSESAASSPASGTTAL